MATLPRCHILNKAKVNVATLPHLEKRQILGVFSQLFQRTLRYRKSPFRYHFSSGHDSSAQEDFRLAGHPH
jgi:hypothetical protein